MMIKNYKLSIKLKNILLKWHETANSTPWKYILNKEKPISIIFVL